MDNKKTVHSIMAVAQILFFSATTAFSSVPHTEIPEPLKKSKSVHSDLDEAYFDVLVDVYKDRWCPSWRADHKKIQKVIDDLCEAQYVPAIHFKLKESMGLEATSYLSMDDFHKPIYPYTASTARALIEALVRKGDSFGVKCYVDSLFEGRFGYPSMDDQLKEDLIEDLCKKGYYSARLYMIDALQKGHSGFEKDLERAEKLVLEWALEGDSKFRVQYLRNALVNETGADQHHAIELLNLWSEQKDSYLESHFNLDYEVEFTRQRREIVEEYMRQIKQLSSMPRMGSADESDSSEEDGAISEKQTLDCLSECLFKYDDEDRHGLNIMLFASLEGAFENMKVSGQITEEQAIAYSPITFIDHCLMAGYKISLPLGNSSYWPARCRILTYLKNESPEKYLSLLEKWAFEGHKKAQKLYVQHVSQSDSDVDNLTPSDENIEKVCYLMKSWRVIPSFLEKSKKGVEDSSCTIM